MLNYIALRIRLITLIFLAVIGVVIVLLLCKKKFKTWEKIVTIALALSLVLLGGSSTIKSLINPDVKTFVGVYESESRVKEINPLQMEYCFDCDGEKIYCDLDLISKNKIFDNDFEKDKKYTISYEINSNLIVAVSENTSEETESSDLKEDYKEVDIMVLYQKFLNNEITALDSDATEKVLNDFLLHSSEPLEYKYTYFDMTGDGIKELCVKQYSSISFFTVKNSEIHHWYTTGSYTSLLNNGALLYERHGGAPIHISYEFYELDKNANKIFNVTFSWWDGKTIEHGKVYPDSYLFNDKEISKEEYEEKTKEYLTIGDDEIIWY